MCAVSMMGGVFAILPAYEADLFGTKFVGAIHGRMLLFSSAAALAGEMIVTTASDRISITMEKVNSSNYFSFVFLVK